MENFRGIKSLDWHLNGRAICLIGPNDSTKTTVLDAIELVLLPRWYTNLTDADFYYADLDSTILIDSTIGDIPSDLLVEPEKFGLYLRGYHDGEIHDDPVNDQLVITVRFKMDRDLDPSWDVYKLSQDQPKPLRWKDRERMGLARLGADADRHLTWVRGSALSRRHNTQVQHLPLSKAGANRRPLIYSIRAAYERFLTLFQKTRVQQLWWRRTLKLRAGPSH